MQCVTVEIQQQNVKFKLDTGGRCNVLPEHIYENLHFSSQLMKTNTRLVSYSGNVMEVEGEVMLDTLYKGQKYPVQFYVVQPATQAICILGLKSCEQLNLIYRVEEMCKRQSTEEGIFDKYEDLYSTASIGCLPITHQLETNEKVKPVVHATRLDPAALRPKIKAELDRMEQMEVISPVTNPTDWVSSLVTIVKPDKIRLCIEPKNLNDAVKREHYPVKTIESVLTRLPEAKIFSTLDAASGFWQIPLDQESSLLTCFNTPFGRYKFNRLPFGVKSAPEVYQRTMEELFGDIEGAT